MGNSFEFSGWMNANSFAPITGTCQHCGENWQTVACAQYQEYCDACRQVLEWEKKTNQPREVRLYVAESWIKSFIARLR